MTLYFRSYASNLNRVRLAEFVDQHVTLLRHERARPSLIVNPLNGQPYTGRAGRTQDASPLRGLPR
ncbi:MAG TPA: hypothetical protein VM620_11030 [Hyphomicrobium sp.]|jgi:hypothetical protein|nr:hypothetical protein [Hyphomicrobium sp.]